ncbi:MAG: capsule-associated protein CAP1 [Trizodia sp. TS-e1964]|nr:MAG: capsule-associated protein CAP1 [Trizodia sp. TS-e1964]
MRSRQFTTLLLLISFAILTLVLLRQHPPPSEELPLQSPQTSLNPPPSEPQGADNSTPHPIFKLISAAHLEFEQLKSRQSRSLAAAVLEYRRRYQAPPPPNFDKWYEFATRKGVQLIDEYDAIYDSLLPFWALAPSTVRERVRESIGFDNKLIALSIRDGQARQIVGGEGWQQKATVGMINGFIQHLPDMDIAFNIHDEPRVIIPHEDLARLVSKAKNTAIPAAFSNGAPRNSFSSRPLDMNDGTSIQEVKTTRFNVFPHQSTWTTSRLSCAPQSPARSMEEPLLDDHSSYAESNLGFVFNQTAFSDICASPSLRQTYGFFDRPNAYNIVHDLFPIFSQSKISSYQDILYPSPWYWSGKVNYDEHKDYEWEDKRDQLYWRGSTTGGFSRGGGWRRQHRQIFVQKINALDEAIILEKPNSTSQPAWSSQAVSRETFKSLFNISFSGVGQCDPDDCEAQKEFFSIAPPADQQDAWAWKYLVDIDGNAFSGRFYAFLKSRSLVFKSAVFREWHSEWLKPWVHFIPLSLHGKEYVEAVRYFANEKDGKIFAPRVASEGREWAGKVLRNSDFEVWFFRLLLEYGRIIDNDREKIGYSAS